MKTLVVCSGGLDSVTLAHLIKRDQTLSAILTFDYGQRHRKEMAFAEACAKQLQCAFHVMDIRNIGNQLSGSALLGDGEIPHGHYAEANMQATVVPNRNAIMLTIAFGMAAAQQLDAVAIAVHGGDHFIYADCRPSFIQAFANMQQQALDGVASVQLLAPFLEHDKSYIAGLSAELGIAGEQTWSCYEGGESHCGRCGTCVERREAFALTKAHDNTHYADADYWHSAIREFKEKP